MYLPRLALAPDHNYYSAMARYGRFIPDLMPRVMQMREKENKETIRNRKSLPHIRNALQNVPSEDFAAQRIIQNKMRTALDDMHRQIVDDIAKFIDNKLKDIGWLTSPVNIDYIASASADYLVQAYDKDQLQALLKLLTFFALVVDTQEVSPKLHQKVIQWHKLALPMLEELQVGKRNLRLFDPTYYHLPQQGKVPNQRQHALQQGMKEARKLLRSDKANKQFATSPELTNRYQRYLNSLFTFFNSDSDRAYDAIVNNVHIMGDHDLNSMLTPEFKGNPTAEARKLANLVSKHGGTGHTLVPTTVEHLQTHDPEALKTYRKQYNMVRDAVRTEIRKLVRASGKPMLRADIIKQGLEKVKLPTVVIPQGFERGFYDQDMNMYSPDGKQLSVNINTPGSWVKWSNNPNLKSIGQYRTPFMTKGPAGIYTLEHTTGGRQEKKYGDVKENIDNIDELKQRWVQDTQSNDEKTKLCANMALAMYYLSMRVGNPGNQTADEPTFGLSTFKIGHVYHRGNALIFKFPGKSGMSQELKLEPVDRIRARLIDYIEHKMQGKSRNDPLWTYGNRTKPISSSSVNTYLKSTGWAGSAKTFRTLRGTLIMEQELVDEPKSFRTRNAAIDYLIGKLGKVGKVLGHKRTDSKTGAELETWRTAATAYVDPKLITDYFRRQNVNPMPNWAEKLGRK